ncbi:prephenate dehydrogenase/arogenate dehydrogenase family protein [Holophaga foetida]|uniref:prephenate dehydrogenase/arogenate dehydrogenase family protein n=1 Tax=Holophaga foetida TaxID=35839 RepID=UPI0002473754|nr:prephenate dehydrogenase/arogenate dehydrogenase family protein [Holophaga foetida]
MPQVGIIGFGHFGRAFGTVMEEVGYTYLAYDPYADVPEALRAVSLRDLAERCSCIALAVPVAAMDAVLRELRPLLGPDHLIFDVCSVKTVPCRQMDEILGEIPHVGTHPLFGPKSLARAERPFRTVLCPSPQHPAAADRVRDLFLALGFLVVDQTPEDHDRVMAQTHALTFFLAKGLLEVGCGGDLPFSPPSFHAIALTLDSVREDAGHLFTAIQNENPFARASREHFLEALQDIHREVEEAARSGSEEAEKALAIPDLGSRSPELQEARDLIDQFDRTLVTLLGRRLEMSRKAGRAKAKLGAPILDPAREESLMAVRRTWAQEAGLDPDAVEELFRGILRVSRRTQGDGKP